MVDYWGGGGGGAKGILLPSQIIGGDWPPSSYAFCTSACPDKNVITRFENKQ